MNHEPIWTLVHAAFDGSITPEQADQLGVLLESDPEACRIYGECAAIEAELHLLIRTRNASRKSCGQIAAEAQLEEENALPSPAPANAPVLGFLGNIYNNTVGFFSQDLPFSLLVATVVTGLGLWIGSLIAITHHIQVAKAPSLPSASRTAADSSIKFIGRISGMVDVKWADPQTATVYGANVAVGRKYALASGLLEITYDMGAKVLLQGPVSYEVDSPESGSLSVGKLTAKLEKRGEGRGEREEKVVSGQQLVASGANPKSQIAKSQIAKSQIAKSQISNSQSLIPNPSLSTIHYPLFTIKTPSAVVTDLGTEFGVDVDASGRADVHVFVGIVECRSTAKTSNGLAKGPLCLTKNMAAQFLPNGDVVQDQPADHERFAQFNYPKFIRRALPLVGFYPLDGNARDQSGRGNHVPSESIHGVTFVLGYEGESAHFEPKAGSFIDLPIDARPTSMQKLTWGAWVRPRTIGPDYMEILSTDITGYGRTLTIDDRAGEVPAVPNKLRFAAFLGNEGTDKGVLPSSGPLPQANQWTFVASVYDDIDHRVSLFVEDKTLHNGKGGLIEDRTIGVHFGPAIARIRVGGHDSQGTPFQPFDGDIDNVFVFRELLGIKELELIRQYGATAITALAKGELLPEERREAGIKDNK